MPIIVNGTTIPENVADTLDFNGTKLKEVYCNGVLVWKQNLIPPVNTFVVTATQYKHIPSQSRYRERHYTSGYTRSGTQNGFPLNTDGTLGPSSNPFINDNNRSLGTVDNSGAQNPFSSDSRDAYQMKSCLFAAKYTGDRDPKLYMASVCISIDCGRQPQFNVPTPNAAAIRSGVPFYISISGREYKIVNSRNLSYRNDFGASARAEILKFFPFNWNELANIGATTAGNAIQDSEVLYDYEIRNGSSGNTLIVIIMRMLWEDRDFISGQRRINTSPRVDFFNSYLSFLSGSSGEELSRPRKFLSGITNNTSQITNLFGGNEEAAGIAGVCGEALQNDALRNATIRVYQDQV